MARYSEAKIENTNIDPWELLASQIVVQAIEDWRLLIDGKAWDKEFPRKWCNFDELRAFFKSQYCELLMLDCEIEPLEILRMLEEELRDAKRASGIAGKEERG